METHKKYLAGYLKDHKLGNSRKDRGVKTNSGEETQSSCKATKASPTANATSSDVSKKRETIHTNSSRADKTISRTKTASRPSKKPSLDTLPDELVLKIFDHLGPNDLLNSARVCRRWLHLTNDNVLWHRLYEKYVKKKKQTKQNKLGQKSPAATTAKHSWNHWKSKCILELSELRNSRVLSLMKRPKGFNGLPKQQDSDTAIKRLGTQWLISLTDKDNKEHVVSQSDVFFFQMSLCIRWYTLEFPSVKSLKKLNIYAANPVFFNSQQEPLPNSACQRSLIMECLVNSRHLSESSSVASDDKLDVKLVLPGLMVALYKADGEIAFITFCVHKHNILERSMFGSSSRPYIPRLARPPPDDLDSQKGLHGYTCCVELRNQRNSAWSQIFREVYCKLENVRVNKDDSMAKFQLIKEDCSYEHSPIGKRLTFPWKTDLFKGVIKNFCILDITVIDEHKSPIWTVSSPVQLVDPHSTDVTYDYDGSSYNIHYEDMDVGAMDLTMVWEPEIDQYMIKQADLYLSLSYINHWFGASY